MDYEEEKQATIEEKSTPLVPETKWEPEPSTSKLKKEIFSFPLVHYRRFNPMNRNQGSEPRYTQLILQNKAFYLGCPPPKESRQQDQNSSDDLIVFSTPGKEITGPVRIFTLVLLVLLLADLVIVSLIYFGRESIESALAAERTGDVETAAYGFVMAALGMAAIGMLLKNARILTLFIVVYYVDAILTLVRVYTVAQFIHFLLQMGICYCCNQFRGALIANWFSPAA